MKQFQFTEVISDITSKFKKIKKSNYMSEGRYRIIDQGKKHIAGYTNDETIINPKLSPIIIFGDHTKIIKYEKNPLALGADGAKALKVDPKMAYDLYVYHFLKSITLKDAGYSRHFKFLKELKIPIPMKGGNPDLQEQKRIAAILDKADAMRQKRKKSIQRLDDFLKSTFLDMFGDPVKNEKGWERTSFPSTGKFVSGGTPSKKRGDFWGGAFPWVSPKDMKKPFIEESQDHITEKVFKETALKKIQAKHLLIVVRGMILAHSFPTAVNLVPITINQDMKAICPNKNLNVLYFMACLNGMKKQILSLVSSAGHGTKRLDAISMEKILIPIPSISLQNEFAEIVKKTEAIKEKYLKSLQNLDDLFNSLSQRAFKGELEYKKIPLKVKGIGESAAEQMLKNLELFNKNAPALLELQTQIGKISSLKVQAQNLQKITAQMASFKNPFEELRGINKITNQFRSLQDSLPQFERLKISALDKFRESISLVESLNTNRLYINSDIIQKNKLQKASAFLRDFHKKHKEYNAGIQQTASETFKKLELFNKTAPSLLKLQAQLSQQNILKAQSRSLQKITAQMASFKNPFEELKGMNKVANSFRNLEKSLPEIRKLNFPAIDVFSQNLSLAKYLNENAAKVNRNIINNQQELYAKTIDSLEQFRELGKNAKNHLGIEDVDLSSIKTVLEKLLRLGVLQSPFSFDELQNVMKDIIPFSGTFAALAEFMTGLLEGKNACLIQEFGTSKINSDNSKLEKTIIFRLTT